MKSLMKLFWLSIQISVESCLPSNILQISMKDGASACWCALFCFVLHFNSVFCDNTRSSVTREELMNIRVTSSEYLSPIFILPSLEILDILVKGALTFAHAVKHRRRGKRAGALVSLTCVPCSTNWTNYNCCWEKTGTFLHLLFCASRRRGCVD